MADQAAKNPRIGPGWLRIILFGAGFILVTVLLLIPAAMTLLSANLPAIKADPAHAMTNIMGSDQYLWLVVVLEALVSFITVFVFWKFIDRRSLDQLGFQLTGFAAEAASGFFIGPAILGISALLLMFTGHVQWLDITLDFNALFISFGLMVLVAFSEELVFRGYILANLLDSFSANSKGRSGDLSDVPLDANGLSSRNKYIALGISALLFAIFHLANPGMSTLAFINLIMAGILLGLNYIHTRNLWFSILFHLAWNFFQGPILGFKVSGLNLPTLLQAETKGDMMLTGGDFGLEGSILNTAVSLTAILVLAWAFERKYNSRKISGNDARNHPATSVPTA